MEDWEARIEIDEENLGGKPVIKGTGVAVHVLLRAMSDGDSVATVGERFGITREDVLAALAYGTNTVADEVLHLVPLKRRARASQ
jgi:uncharacterized protein (DUF433 family)